METFFDSSKRIFLRNAATKRKFQKKVRPAGLEPATLGLEIPCSIQLSYGRKACFLSSKTHWKMVCYSQILKCGLLATSLDRPILAR